MSSSTAEIAYLNYISRISLTFGGLILFITGIIGNSINIFVFSFFPQFNKGSTPVFLLFSFISSLTTLLTGLLPQLVFRLSGTDPLVTYLVLCKLRWFIGIGSATVAVHCLSLAAANQYLLTSRHIRHHQWINRRRALLMCLVVTIYSLGSISPNLVYYTHIKNSINQTQCDITNTIAATYNTYNGLIIYSLLPIIVLSTFSLLTWWNIRHKMIRQASIEQSLTRLVFAQITMVLLASIGFVIRRIYLLYTKDFAKNTYQIAQENVANSAFTLIGFIIHSFSFLTYLISSKPFRQNISSLLFTKKHRIQPTTNLMRTTP
ncbi:unnamed protein product [Adineta ricciae]|uniref:G-protein coupled receptors family 1 profile domain-containing protein n=1 Tax=Adineta ricciae TaxID=249248 RepID=A0A815V741_ADIRI|nr:unnamed protein product [Adineta ricciae]